MTPPVDDFPLWFAGSRKLPRLVGQARADVCVVGLGGSGLSAIARLVEAGRRVVGVDAAGVAAGAAGRNGGFLLAGPAEFHHKLASRLGRDLARSFYGLTIEARDRIISDCRSADPRGSLRLASSSDERRDCLAQLEALQADGFDGKWIESEASYGGLLIPGDGVFDPVQRCLDLAEAVADRAELYGSTPALLISPESVKTPLGEIRAEAILVCVDGGLDRLVPDLKDRVRSLRLQMLATAPAQDVSIDHAVYFRFGYDYWQQRPDGRIALGGARDVGGEAEETHERGITAKVQGALDRLLRETIQTKAKITHRWSGIVGYSADGLPVGEELATLGSGIFACGGYSGHGNVLGTLLAESLADLALGRRTPETIAWLKNARQALAQPPETEESPET